MASRLIDLRVKGLTKDQERTFQEAADRWEHVITGKDLGRVTIPDTGEETTGIIIKASAVPIDGLGEVLGQAGPEWVRADNRLPCSGTMEFDEADLAFMESGGILKAVILHEMAHVLGIGTLWDHFIINYETDPHYVGVHALGQYNEFLKKVGLAPVNSIPVENKFGPGSYGGHWRESVFDDELMSSQAEAAGTPHPLSRMTIGVLKDLGYQVEYGPADEWLGNLLDFRQLRNPKPSEKRRRGSIRLTYKMARPVVRVATSSYPAVQTK